MPQQPSAPSAPGTSGPANGGSSPAPSTLSVSSGPTKISFAIPAAATQKQAAKPAPISLDARATLPSKPLIHGLPARPLAPPARNGNASTRVAPIASSSSPAPRGREEYDRRSISPRKMRSRSRSRDRDRERERERDRDRDRDRDRGDKWVGRDRDRDRDRGDAWRSRDDWFDRRGDRYDRDRYSRSPDKRDRDRDDRGGRPRAYSRDLDRRDHRDDFSRSRVRSRSPIGSPDRRSSRRSRSPDWRDTRLRRSPSPRRPSKRSPSPPPRRMRRSPSPRRLKRSPSPRRYKRTPSPRRSTPKPRPNPPSEKDKPPPPAAPPPSEPSAPPPPAAEQPPPPPSSPPPPPPSLPSSKPASCVPSRPLTPQKLPSKPVSTGPKAIPTGPRASIPTGPKAETVRAATPPPPWKPPPSAFRRPGIGNWLLIPDPAGGPKDVKRFDGVYNGIEAKVQDPRIKIPRESLERGHGYMKNRSSGLLPVTYEWDENSPGPKPPPPPDAVLLTGLNPLTTVDHISKFLRPHGKIKEIDLKMDKSGMQLGICWVKFEGPLPGKTGTAHDVAVQVVKVCDGQRVGVMGQERVKVVLDGRGLRAAKAYHEEMDRRYKPKPKPVVQPPSGPAAMLATTPDAGRSTPKSDATPNSRLAPVRPPPRGPKFETFGRNFASLNRSLPIRGFQSIRGGRPMQDLSRSFRPAPVQDFSRDFRGPGPRGLPRADVYSPATSSRSRSRSRSRSSSRSVSSSSSDSDDEPSFRRRRGASPRRAPRGPARAAVEKKEADEAAAERTKAALTANTHTYVFIDIKSLPAGQAREEHVRDHFRAFKPENVLHSPSGWHVLFGDDQSAYRAQRVLDKTAVQGHRINIEVRAAKADAAGDSAAPEEKGEKGGWRFLTITKKRPTITPAARRPLPSTSPKRSMRHRSYTDSEDEKDVRKPGPKRVIASDSESEDEEIVPKPVVKEPVKVEPVVEAKSVEPTKKATKRPAKPKESKDKKKARITTDTALVEPAVAEIKIKSKPKAKPKKKTALEKLIEAGSLVDDEDAYWLGKAMAVERGADLDLSDDEDELDEEHPLFHSSGAWRAEGFKKIPSTQKSAYLPQRNRAVADAAEAVAAMHGGTAGLSTGRTARMTGRRLALDMESHRKAMGSGPSTTESDLFQFNQLGIRRKQLRFARSAIEGYGLFAMETIHPGEMVCEYVGEVCRSAVAEVREQKYMKQGIGSSYLFRIDGDLVCDATFKGSVSRLINHSCDPTANAKIININGQSKIVIYAKQTLNPGDECTYHYRFPLETDPTKRVVCFCGSEKCTGFLN